MFYALNGRSSSSRTSFGFFFSFFFQTRQLRGALSPGGVPLINYNNNVAAANKLLWPRVYLTQITYASHANAVEFFTIIIIIINNIYFLFIEIARFYDV